MKFIMKIEMDNAAFDDNYELPRLLSKVTDSLYEYGGTREGYEFAIMDINGNHVGDAKIIK
jgi:hypothetical protein